MKINPHEEVAAMTDTEAIPATDALLAPIKSNEILGRRAKAAKSAWGTAAPATSTAFKFDAGKDKPKAKRWDQYLSAESLSRGGSSLKEAARFLKTPGIISLGGGLPSSQYFPFDSLDFRAPSVGRFSEAETASSGVDVHAGKHDLAANKSIFDIETALQYGQGHGAAQLLRWMTEHTELVHRPPYADWQCTMTVGSTSALDMALRMFTRPGDCILSEEYTFATAVETAAPMGVRVAGVEMDDQGLIPSSMDAVLAQWEPSRRHGARKPRVLYTVPTGQNPTGATQSAQRRRAVYAVARKHDVFILEDEPYYFLQMEPYAGQHDAGPAAAAPPASHEAFLAALVPSLLSIDVDGRVMRMDSLSKVISPGARLGWITACEQVVDRYKTHADVSTQGPSGVSQLLAFKLLDEHWGHAGYLDWLAFLRREYSRRRDAMLAACERHLPREVVSWKPPMAGMFHWLRVRHELHPRWPEKRVAELEDEVWRMVIDHGALLMKGSWFVADKDAEVDAMLFRATYAAESEDKIDEAIRRFGDAVREAFGLPAAAANGGAAVGGGELACENGGRDGVEK